MSLSACVGILEIIFYSRLPHFRPNLSFCCWSSACILSSCSLPCYWTWSLSFNALCREDPKGTKSRSEVSVDWFRWNWVEIFNKGEWQCYYSTEWPFFSHHCVYRKIRAVFVEIRKNFPSKNLCIFVKIDKFICI